ncbi:hypothetical protein AALP_AA2G219400 [Arabis alpina]|uniref:Uncharacterized protein n=1 Tax=Arabis alpina TaxID=50452 RepID=A0A087HJ61_ARAAL|nr:hypothetical protein AALP_AA2G219400 [Arabis alpina]
MVSCVLIFFVIHNAKVEADSPDFPVPYIYHFSGTVCDSDPARAAGQCRFETQDDKHPRCDCRNVKDGHECLCMGDWPPM